MQHKQVGSFVGRVCACKSRFLQFWGTPVFFSVGAQLFCFCFSVLGHSCFLQCWGTAVVVFQCWDTAVFFSVETQLFTSVLGHSWVFFSSFFSQCWDTAVFFSVGTQLDLICSVLGHGCLLHCWDTAVFFSVGAQLFSSVSGHFSNKFNTKQQELGHWQLPKMLHQKDASRQAVRK